MRQFMDMVPNVDKWEMLEINGTSTCVTKVRIQIETTE
jgi:hypothetical protein